MYLHHSNNIIKNNESIDSARSRSKIHKLHAKMLPYKCALDPVRPVRAEQLRTIKYSNRLVVLNDCQY